MRLATATAKAADVLKSPKLYRKFCKHGHSMDRAYVYFRYGYRCRRCRLRDRRSNAEAGVLEPGQIERASIALRNGATINQIIHGLAPGGRPYDQTLILIHPSVFYRYRRANPEFNRFVLDAIDSRICLRDPISLIASGTLSLVERKQPIILGQSSEHRVNQCARA
nr:hypothetical protein CIT39_14590 [Bradyrhizobium symbiodeficiens]